MASTNIIEIILLQLTQIIMKTMICKNLWGPESCDMEFHAKTWEEMVEQSKKHWAHMIEEADDDHLEAMSEMSNMMQDPQEMKDWMDARKAEFEALPLDSV